MWCYIINCSALVPLPTLSSRLTVVHDMVIARPEHQVMKNSTDLRPFSSSLSWDTWHVWCMCVLRPFLAPGSLGGSSHADTPPWLITLRQLTLHFAVLCANAHTLSSLRHVTWGCGQYRVLLFVGTKRACVQWEMQMCNVFLQVSVQERPCHASND